VGGWNHHYHYDMQGRLQKQLTSGDWPVLDVIGVDLQGGQVYFTAHHDQVRPYDVHLCRVALAGGEVRRLTPDEGVHEIQLDPGFKSFVATRSLPYMAPRSEVRRSDGQLVHSFAPADVSALKDLGWTPPEQFKVKAADGETDLWGVIFKPADFDPAKRYPVIESIYGGPQIVNTPHNFHAPVRSPFSALHAALPQLGYVVVVLDARGTPERSKAFQDVSYKEWRRHVGKDHACALRTLASERPWMDLSRVGIWGHSWGGYHTVACMLDHPDVYRAGVASAPGVDPYNYFIYEPYLGGVPNAGNAAAYRDAALLADVPGLKGALMVVAGSSDVGPWQDAFKLANTLIKAGVDHEFVLLPDEIHGYGAKHEAYFIHKLVKHFNLHLKLAPGGAQ
jgi:dipeptidyl aminopeptidase/acylaminoacyl peptidase